MWGIGEISPHGGMKQYKACDRKQKSLKMSGSAMLIHGIH